MIEFQKEALFQLYGQQKTLYDELLQYHSKLANMYYGSLHVLASKGNVDRFALASHGIRELMEKLPRYLDTPIETQKKSRLKEEIRHLSKSWASVLKHPQWSNYNWKGRLNSPLISFLNKTTIFFEWFEKDYQIRKEQTARVLKLLDPLQRPLPKPIEKIRIEEWDCLNSYFQGVSHHTIETEEAEFEKRLLTLENFLLEQIKPKTFNFFDDIDLIIKEGESNDNF